MYRDVETFSNMDPYVVIEYNGKTYKTPALQEAGKHPLWNHSFEILMNSNENLKISCFDENIINDTLIAEAPFNTNELSPNNGHWFKLYFKGTVAAEILIEPKLSLNIENGETD